MSHHLCFRPDTEGKPMAQNSIIIRHIHGGGWEVAIVENGKEDVRPFGNGGFALSWAEGQSVRLGVPVQHQQTSYADLKQLQ